MERVLEGIHCKTVLSYLDDVIVIGQTFEQKLEGLLEAFARFRDAYLNLCPPKMMSIPGDSLHGSHRECGWSPH